MPPNSSRQRSSFEPARITQNGARNGSGAIEKTNMMSSENPFVDPARPYEHFKSPRTVTSITSPPKTGSGGIVKSLNLSDENPFFSTYSRYQYPAQIDPTKRITTLGAGSRSIDTKSLNLSDENPFFATYARYQQPSTNETQKKITETPKISVPLNQINDFSDENRLNTHRPLTIREYSMSGISIAGSGSTTINPSPTFSTTIGDWIRSHPAPLSHRPIEVRRPPQDFYGRNPLANSSTNLLSARQSPPTARITPQRNHPTSPLEKTSLNMSPENPFADTYGRYHYPSADEIKTQKRVIERSTRPLESLSGRENRMTTSINEPIENEKKEITSGKGGSKFTRFDIDL